MKHLLYVIGLTLVTSSACHDTRKSCYCDTDCPEVFTDLTVEHLEDIAQELDTFGESVSEPIEDPTSPLPRYRCPCQDMRFYEVCAPDDDLAMLEAQRLCRLVDPDCDCWDGCELIGWCE